MKTKIKFFGDEVTDFYNKEIPKVDFNHTCLAVMSLDSTFNKDGNYYPKVLLKECKVLLMIVVVLMKNSLMPWS